MEREYAEIKSKIKQEAMSVGGIGFIAPGMLTPRGPKGRDEA
jgi:transitional endoplasmic reticulum ATPase